MSVPLKINSLLIRYSKNIVAYMGPYKITQMNNNGTVRVNEGTITDVYNFRNITPYFSTNNIMGDNALHTCEASLQVNRY